MVRSEIADPMADFHLIQLYVSHIIIYKLVLLIWIA